MLKFCINVRKLRSLDCKSDFIHSYDFSKNLLLRLRGHDLYSINILLDNSFVRFGNSLFCQNVVIPMGANYAPLIADLFLFCNQSQYIANIQQDPSKH